MTAGILAILGAVVPFVIWLWKRRATKADDKYHQHEKRTQAAHSAIARGDSDAVNALLDSQLRRLQARSPNPSGQDGNSTSRK